MQTHSEYPQLTSRNKSDSFMVLLKSAVVLIIQLYANLFILFNYLPIKSSILYLPSVEVCCILQFEDCIWAVHSFTTHTSFFLPAGNSLYVFSFELDKCLSSCQVLEENTHLITQSCSSNWASTHCSIGFTFTFTFFFFRKGNGWDFRFRNIMILSS